MKAMFVVPWPSRSGGGVFDAVRNLAIQLNRNQNVDMEILSLEDEFFSRDASLWNPLKPKVLPVTWPKKLGYAPIMLTEMLSAKPDVIHCHGLWLYQSLACLRWHERERKPYLISPHGMLDPGDLIKSVWKKRLVQILYQGSHLNRTACVHALCESEATAIRNYGVKSKICIVPNGVDLPTQLALETTPPSRLESGQKVLLYLGRITPKKGLSTLLDAWAMLKKQGRPEARDWRLDIAGWEQYGHEAELKAKAKALDVKDTVRFLGPRHGMEKEATYRSADAYILPSLSEGLPLVVLEAWSYSLPVVMTPQCNLPEGFKSEAAICAEPSTSSLCEGLNQLISMSDSERSRMGALGRKLVEERFTWESVAKKMHSVYKWAIGGGDTPECVMND